MKIIWDHRDAMAETGIKFDSRHHVLLDGEWVMWAKRVMGWPDLMVYRHRIRGSFVLTDLVYPDSMIGREIKILPCPPDQGGWVGRVWLEKHAKPMEMTLDEIANKWKSEAVTRQDVRVESRDMQADTERHLRRHGMEETADILKFQPYSASSDTAEKAKTISKFAHDATTTRVAF